MQQVIFIILLGLFLNGCGEKSEPKMNTEMGKHMEHETGIMDTEKEPGIQNEVVTRKARKNEIGKAAQCPVMGSKFNVDKNTEAADYKGSSYYFCCAGCPGMFKDNPEKYIK